MYLPQSDQDPENVTSFKTINDSMCFDVERVMGIEPTYSAWEADVLPLNYTREN